MKYFTLLYGDQLSQAPKKKVIPAEEFSTLLNAEEALQKVSEEAERYREDVAKECEKLKEEAEKTGFEEGKTTWAEQINLLEESIAKTHEELKAKLVPIVLQAAKKVVGREIEISKETIADIVIQNLRSVAGHRRVTIYCNRNDLDTLQENKERLKEVFERLESLAVQEREDIQPGGCVIETESGIINAQADHIWQALETALKRLL